MRPVPMSRFPLLAFVVAVPATTRRSAPSTTRPTKWAKFTSIAIGTDGFPVISYFDLTHGKLGADELPCGISETSPDPRSWTRGAEDVRC